MFDGLNFKFRNYRETPLSGARSFPNVISLSLRRNYSESVTNLGLAFNENRSPISRSESSSQSLLRLVHSGRDVSTSLLARAISGRLNYFPRYG